MTGSPTANSDLSPSGCLPVFPSQSSTRRPPMKYVSSPSAKRPAAKRKSSSMQSKTDWDRLKSKASVSAAPEHPEADIRHVMRGVVRRGLRSEEHTSELQSLMRISYAVFCLKKKTKHNSTNHVTYNQQQ